MLKGVKTPNSNVLLIVASTKIHRRYKSKAISSESDAQKFICSDFGKPSLPTDVISATHLYSGWDPFLRCFCAQARSPLCLDHTVSSRHRLKQDRLWAHHQGASLHSGSAAAWSVARLRHTTQDPISLWFSGPAVSSPAVEISVPSLKFKHICLPLPRQEAA